MTNRTAATPLDRREPSTSTPLDTRRKEARAPPSPRIPGQLARPWRADDYMRPRPYKIAHKRPNVAVSVGTGRPSGGVRQPALSGEADHARLPSRYPRQGRARGPARAGGPWD